MLFCVLCADISADVARAVAFGSPGGRYHCSVLYSDSFVVVTRKSEKRAFHGSIDPAPDCSQRVGVGVSSRVYRGCSGG